ncbi:MAG: hypothetical protein ACYTG0_43525 [Planctomycetota bacterium]|jgi:hypothetical protein
MDPQALIDPTASGIPAPGWFIQLFKVLGFTLHAVPMNLWYAGIVVAMVLYTRGGEQGKRFAGRLMSQMPIVIAFGINLGVVPLLFVQLAYFKVFYPATILMGWFWLAVVGLLIPAYYGVYVYAFGLRGGEESMTPLKRTIGWAAAALFIVVGFIFVNAFSLMGDVGRWADLWEGTSKGGAALGTALNVADVSLWPRWLMMFSLAVGTTAVWVVVDAAWLAGGESDEYKGFAQDFAWKLYSVGAAAFAVTGLLYLLTWPTAVHKTMWLGLPVGLTLLTALSPAVPWLLMVRARRLGQSIARPMAAWLGLAQFGVLGLNAVSRQIVQNVKLSSHQFDVLRQPEAVQWSPLIVFLLAFVAGLGVIAWMIAQVLTASPEPAE